MERALVEGVVLLAALVSIVYGVTQMLDRWIKTNTQRNRLRRTLRRVHRREHDEKG